MLTDIVLGSFGTQGQRSFYTYVRLSDDENVYAADNFMKMSIPATADGYRNNDVLRLDSDSLTVVSFNYPDSAFALARNETWFTDDGVPADSSSVASFLQGLRFSTSRSFYDKSIPGHATHTITFSFSDQPDIIVEGFNTDDGFIIRSSENESESFLDGSLTTKIFKGKSSFISQPS